MKFNSPEKQKHSIDYANQFTPEFKKVFSIVNTEPIQSIYFTFFIKPKTKLYNDISNNCSIESKTINHSPNNNSLSVRCKSTSCLKQPLSLNKTSQKSIIKSTLSAKLHCIYNQFIKGKKEWVNLFQSFCEQENINLNEIKINKGIKTYNENQSFISLNELFWILAIFYIKNYKKKFDIEDLVQLTHIAIDLVKNVSFIIKKCYVVIMMTFKHQEKVNYTKKKRLVNVNYKECFEFLNDDSHRITKPDGTLIQMRSNMAKKKKLCDDINKIAINIHDEDKENNNINTINRVLTFRDENQDFNNPFT